MIKRLDEIAQKEFDERVRKSKRWNFLRTNIFGRKIDSPTRNHYTNNIFIIPYDRFTKAVVKSPSVTTSIRYNTTAWLFRSAGLIGYEYSSDSSRIRTEKSRLGLLHDKGCDVPSLVYTNVEGVVATEYLEGQSFDALEKEAQIDALEKATKSLRDIHQYSVHGDPSAQNIRLSDGKSYWVDLEFILNPRVDYRDLIAQELLLFIESAAKHTGSVKQTVEVICESYDDPELLDRVLKFNKVKNFFYRRIVHNIGYEFAAKVKEAVDEQIGKMLKRAWGDFRSFASRSF